MEKAVMKFYVNSGNESTNRRITYVRKMYHKKLQESIDLQRGYANLCESMDAQRNRIMSLQDNIKKIDSDIEDLISRKYGKDL